MAFSSAGNEYTQSVTATSGGIGAANIPNAAHYAEGYVRTASVVELRNARAPTATLGTQWNVGDLIILRSDDEITAFRAIRQAATDASIDWQFFTVAP